MMYVTYILSAVVLLGLCIFIHELGHLLGGKLVGIKAKVFSMGYGRGVYKKTVNDTTYQVTLIPFGGYVQFYGEDPSESRVGKDYEFLSAAPWKRIVTVAMGPMFNLFFGILLFFVMNMVGYTKETNRVYIPEEYREEVTLSAAYKAGIRDGDRITAINGKRMNGFDDIQSQVIFSDGKELSIEVERDGKKSIYAVVPSLSPHTGRYAIGIIPFGNRVMIADVAPDDVASRAGLQQLDEVLKVDGKEIRTPEEFTDYVKVRMGQSITFDILRSGKNKKVTVTPRSNVYVSIDGNPIFDSRILDEVVKDMSLKLNGDTVFSRENFMEYIRKNKDKTVTLEHKGKSVTGKISLEERGFIGVYLAIAPEMVEVKFGVIDGLAHAFVEPYDFIVMNVKGIGMLFAGEMNVRENLSGPIRIAKIAGDVAYYKGIAAFILLMAKISIVLMVMNLLPIPAVDGSHLLFFTIEAIRGKPLNQKIMERIQTVGVLILILIGIFVIVNDISMLPIIQKLFN
ncbi:MAG: RIP metalloprotease RseP [Spirochaetae bacterium HGW-Spirochaetae-1]|jgi:regulator of sigma E protease|nr:MAG: RIP metalloprotease RseP [Spirochaetae bacterium HGW-Spirochaetae-1]